MEVTVINWDDFMRGELAIYCGNSVEARSFLEMCEERGLDAKTQLFYLDNGKRYSYRWDVEENAIMSVDLENENDWLWHLAHGYVIRVFQFADLEDELLPVPDIQTIDDMLV